jgi:hypothetical protein
VFVRNYTYNLNQQIFVEHSGVAGKPTGTEVCCDVDHTLANAHLGRCVCVVAVDGANEGVEVTAHDQHSDDSGLNTHARHRHHEHDSQLHVPVFATTIHIVLSGWCMGDGGSGRACLC